MASNSNTDDVDVKELKKLSPEARLKRLKELKEKKNRDIEDAEKLIKESIIEIENTEKIRRIPVPEAKVIDLEKLFDFETKEDKKKRKDKVREDAIKEALEDEMTQQGRAGGTSGYQRQNLRVEDLYQNNPNLYQLSGQIYNTLKQFSQQDPEKLDDADKQLLEAIVNKMPQLEVNRTYTTADYVLEKMSASRRILKQMGYDSRTV